jgi:galactokinase
MDRKIAKCLPMHWCAEKLAEISSSREQRGLFVPGRIEFLGKHTDYAGGRSLVCAVEKGLIVAFSPRADRAVRIVDLKNNAQISFDISADLSPAIGHWSNYPMTVARRIARNFGTDLRGADIVFTSDLPASAGLSSSSALIVASFLALSGVNQLETRDGYRANIHSREDLAGYLGAIENGSSFGSLAGGDGVGTFGGSQDHTAILCAQRGALCQYSFAPVRFEREVPLPKDLVFVVACSGVIAEKTAEVREKYNRLSQRIVAIVQLWNEQTNRQDSTLAAAMASSAGAPEMLRVILKNRDPLLVARFEQFFAESEQIIPAVGDALLEGQIEAIGALVDRSQELAESVLGNQVEQTIYLARSARELGALAASAFGAGFGGSVWALVKESDADDFNREWAEQYGRRFPECRDRSAFFTTRAGPSAMRLPSSPGAPASA